MIRYGLTAIVVSTLLVLCTGCGGGHSPPAAALSVTQTIRAADGGTINGPGGIVLTIPPDALAADTDITIALDGSGAPTVPDVLLPLAGPMVSLLPHGTTFSVPVTLSLPVSAAQPVVVFKTNEQFDGWEVLETVQTGDRAEAALTRFSIAATGPRPQDQPPRIIGEPRDSPVLAEGPCLSCFWVFRVDVVARAPYTFRWMRNGFFLPNETNRDILINPTRLADNGALYSVMITDANGRSTTSRAAVLTVHAAAPLIVNSPADAQAVEGNGAFFTAASTSSIAQTLLWKRCDAGTVCAADVSSWQDAGSNSTQLSFPSVTLAHSGTRVAMCASNAAGTSCSQIATLSVVAAPTPPVVVTAPQSLTAAVGTSASFTVVATGGALSFDWQSSHDGVSFAAEARCSNSATCTLSNVQLADDGLQLQVRVFNSAGSAQSSPPALLTARLAAGVALARLGGGNTSSVGLRGDGRLVLWGQSGGVGNGLPFAELGVPADAATLSAGTGHALALRSNGDLLAWGSNTNGQLGDGSTGSGLPNPRPLSTSFGAARSVAAGMGVSDLQARDNTRFSLAVTAANGLVWAWGTNLSGQLGIGTVIEQHTPVSVGRISGVVGVAAGDGHVLARRSDGSVWVWGRNTAGQLGTGNNTASLEPIPIPLADIVAVAAGQDFSLALRSDGTVLSWGSGLTGRLGNGSAQSRSTPAAINLPAPAIGIAAGAQHGLALLLDGRVYAWGRNDQGQTGTGSVISALTAPQRVVAPLPADIVSIGAGAAHSLALDASGNVWAWGLNSTRQLGDGTQQNRLTPVQVQEVNLN